MSKSFTAFLDEKRAIVRQAPSDAPQVQPANTELGQAAGAALASGGVEAPSNIDRFAAGTTGVDPQTTAQGLRNRGITNVDPNDPFAATLTGGVSPSDAAKQRVARNLVLRRDLGGSQGDEADPKFDTVDSTERALGVAAQNARTNLRTGTPKFMIGGQQLVDLDPTAMIGENPATMDYGDELTVEKLMEMLLAVQATGQDGLPRMASPDSLNLTRSPSQKVSSKIQDGDIEKIQMQSQLAAGSAKGKYTSGKSQEPQTGVDITGGFRYLPLAQLIKMSPVLMDKIRSGEIDIPGLPAISDDEYEYNKKRIDLIRRSHAKPTEDMTDEEREAHQADRRAATRELIDMANVYKEVPEEVREKFYDVVLGGAPGATNKRGGASAAEGGYSMLGTSATPERNTIQPEGYTSGAKQSYNFDNKYFGRYGGLNDAWVEKNPELAKLALEYTGKLEQYDQDEEGNLIDTGEFLDENQTRHRYQSRLADMPYDEGMQPGDMVDYMRLVRDKSAADDAGDTERYQQLDALQKAIDRNRLDSFIDMSLKSGMRSFYNEDNMISPSENEVEHMMAVSSGGRDHPSNWTASDTQPNIRRGNNSLIELVDQLVGGQQAFGSRGAVINPLDVGLKDDQGNPLPLDNAEALINYSNRATDKVRRYRLKAQLDAMREGADADRIAEIDALQEYLDTTPVEEWQDYDMGTGPTEPAPEPTPAPRRGPRRPRGGYIEEGTKYEQMPVLAESFMQFRYSYIKQLVEEKDVWNYQEALEAGYSVAKWYRAALAKKGFEFDANDNIVGIDEARYHIKQAQDKKQEIEGKGKEEKDEKEKEGLRKQYRAWDRLEKSETEYYNKYGDTIKARGAADKRKEEEPDDKPRSYYQRPPITDSKTLEIIKKLRAKGKGKK